MKTLLQRLAFLLTFLPAATGLAQGTAFTYQGRLADGGGAASGNYDLRFTIHEAPAGGNTVGGPLTHAAVAVSNGLFSVSLDFGAGVFDGGARWLEIGVRTNGDAGAFTALVPRQEITATPYAVRAANFSGPVADAQLSANVARLNGNQTFTGTVNFSSQSNSYAGTFNGNGGALTNLASGNLTGTLTIGEAGKNGHLDDGGEAHGVAVAGHFAYLANWTDGLRVHDLSSPASPVSVGHVDDGVANAVAVAGGFAYVANDFDGLWIYDVSNPAQPVMAGHASDGGEAYGVAVVGGFAYLANFDDGLRIYDVSNPAQPLSVGHTGDSGGATDGLAWSVAVAGGFAYLANDADGLRVYDISNPANPVSVGHVDSGGAAFGVAVAGNFAYLANGDDGLRIYDVSNPANPVPIAHLDVGGTTYGVTVAGHFAYLANWGDGLRIYDISDPANPVSVGHLDDGGAAYGVAVAGQFACLANGTDGLRVYDLGIATAPYFQGNGYWLTNLNAGRISGGTLADARLSANVALRTGGNVFTGNQTVTGGSVGIGTVNPAAALDVVGNIRTSGSFTGNGDGLTNLNAAQLSAGTVNAARLPANLVRLDASQTFTGSSNVFTGNVGIGTLNPLGRLHVVGSAGSPILLAAGDGSGGGDDGGAVTINAGSGGPSPAFYLGGGGSGADIVLTAGNGRNSSISRGGDGGDITLRPGTAGTGLALFESGNGTPGIVRIVGSCAVNDGITATAFVGNGAGLTSLNPANLSGTVADAKLSANVALLNANQTFTGANVFSNSTGQPDIQFHGSGSKLRLLAFNDGAYIQAGADLTSGSTADLHFTGMFGSPSHAVIKASGNVGIGTTAPANKLHVNGGITCTALTQTSDRNAKENFQTVSPADVLAKVSALPISTWNFKEMKEDRHLGPMAQDFYAAFGLGQGETTITSVDADGVALAAIQGLNQKLERRDAEIGELKQQLSELKALVQKLAGDTGR